MSVPQSAPTPGLLGPDDLVERVPVDRWYERAAELKAAGMGHFDSLHGVDEILRPDPDAPGEEQIRVVLRLVDHRAGRAVQVHTRVERPLGDRRPEPRLPSLAALFAGARWHERELFDFFGVAVTGHAPEPLLWHPGPEDPAHPLLKDEVLVARATLPWPGEKDPDADTRTQASRRRTRPAGVPEAEVWQAEGPNDPVEVARSISETRSRRRR